MSEIIEKAMEEEYNACLKKAKSLAMTDKQVFRIGFYAGYYRGFAKKVVLNE